MPVVNRGSKKWLAELKGRCTCSYKTPKPSVRQRGNEQFFENYTPRSVKLFTLCCACIAISTLASSCGLPNQDIARVKYEESYRWALLTRPTLFSICGEIMPCMYHQLANQNICIHFPAIRPYAKVLPVPGPRLNCQISSHSGRFQVR